MYIYVWQKINHKALEFKLTKNDDESISQLIFVLKTSKEVSIFVVGSWIENWILSLEIQKEREWKRKFVLPIYQREVVVVVVVAFFIVESSKCLRLFIWVKINGCNFF